MSETKNLREIITKLQTKCKGTVEQQSNRDPIVGVKLHMFVHTYTPRYTYACKDITKPIECTWLVSLLLQTISFWFTSWEWFILYAETRHIANGNSGEFVTCYHPFLLGSLEMIVYLVKMKFQYFFRINLWFLQAITYISLN